MQRPTHNGEPHGQFVTTPSAATMAQLLGGESFGSVTLTRDQIERLRKLYSFTPEPANEKPAPPPEPRRDDFKTQFDFDVAHKKWQTAVKALDKWVDPRPLLQAGADRNLARYAEVDGLRLLAWLARYVEPGEDPLKLLVQLASDAGYDIDPSDIDWAFEEVDPENPEDRNV